MSGFLSRFFGSASKNEANGIVTSIVVDGEEIKLEDLHPSLQSALGEPNLDDEPNTELLEELKAQSRDLKAFSEGRGKEVPLMKVGSS